MASDDDALAIDLRPKLDEAAANKAVSAVKEKVKDAGNVPVRPKIDEAQMARTLDRAAGNMRDAGDKGGTQMGRAIETKVSTSMERVKQKVNQTTLSPDVDDSGLKKAAKSADDLGRKLQDVTKKAGAVKDSIDNVDTGHNMSQTLDNAKQLGTSLSSMPGKLGKIGSAVAGVTDKAGALLGVFSSIGAIIPTIQKGLQNLHIPGSQGPGEPGGSDWLWDFMHPLDAPGKVFSWWPMKHDWNANHPQQSDAPAKKSPGSFYQNWYSENGTIVQPGEKGFVGPLPEGVKPYQKPYNPFTDGWQPPLDYKKWYARKDDEEEEKSGEKSGAATSGGKPTGTASDPVHVRPVDDGTNGKGSGSGCWPWLNLGLQPPDITKFLPTAAQLFGDPGAPGEGSFGAPGLGGGGLGAAGCSCESGGVGGTADGVLGSPSGALGGAAPTPGEVGAPPGGGSPGGPPSGASAGEPSAGPSTGGPNPYIASVPALVPFGGSDGSRGGSLGDLLGAAPSSVPALVPFGGSGGSSGGSLGDLLGAAPSGLPTRAAMSGFRGGGPADIAKYIYGAARARGYSDHDATAILAYAVGESGLNPRISGGVQGDDEVIGLFQEKSGFARSGGIDPSQRYTVEGNTNAYLNQLQQHRGGDIMDQLLHTSVGGPMYTGGRGYMDQLMGRARGYLGGGGGSPIKANLTGFGVPVGPGPGEVPGPIPGPLGPISGDIAASDGGMRSNTPKKEAPLGQGPGAGLTGGGILGMAEQLPAMAAGAGGGAGAAFGGGAAAAVAAAAWQDIAVPEINLGVQKGGQALAALAMAPMETMHLAGGQMGAPSVGSAGQSGWTGKLLGSLLGSQFNAANIAGSTAPPKDSYGSDQQKTQQQQEGQPKGTQDDPLHVNVLNGGAKEQEGSASTGTSKAPTGTAGQGAGTSFGASTGAVTASPAMIG